MTENTGPAADVLEQTALVLADAADALAALLARRDALAGELGRIDTELDRIFTKLADDRRVAVPARPVSDAALALTVQTGRRVVPAQHSCQYDVLVAVLAGHHTPRALRSALPAWSADRVKQACTHLVESGWLRRTGATTNIRYGLATASPATRTA